MSTKPLSAVVENDRKPKPPEPTEAHKVDLDSFLADVLAILRLLGVSAFSPGSRPAAEPPSETPSVPAGYTPANAVAGEFFFSLGNAHGRMTATVDGGYLLHRGEGVINADKPGISGSYKVLRKKLRDDHILVPIAENTNHLRLVADLPLPSPSAAGAVLYGGQVNGRTQWKDAHGKTLAECEKAAVEDVP